MDLLERERCLADLAEWLGSSGQHGGCIALLAGEAGIGKSALLEEFCKRQDALRALWGACERSSPRARSLLCMTLRSRRRGRYWPR